MPKLDVSFQWILVEDVEYYRLPELLNCFHSVVFLSIDKTNGGNKPFFFSIDKKVSNIQFFFLSID